MLGRWNCVSKPSWSAELEELVVYGHKSQIGVVGYREESVTGKEFFFFCMNPS